MHYWILKAKPDGDNAYKYEHELGPGIEDNWHRVRERDGLAVGDRVFLWASKPDLRLAGLGVVIRAVGKQPLRVRYLTSQFKKIPELELLKTVHALSGASFLKPQQGTAFDLTPDQARELYRVVTTQNPDIHPWSDWPKGPNIDDIEAGELEGRPELVTHLQRERNPKLAKRKKADFASKNDGLHCEACSKTYEDYGPLTSDIFEVHHRLPLAKAEGPVKTHLKDLAVLCPNCHRAIHRTNPMLKVEELAKRISRNL